MPKKKSKKVILYQAYLLQFQDYNIGRFLVSIKKFCKEKFFIPSGKKIDKTHKAMLLLMIALVLVFVLSLFLSSFFGFGLFLQSLISGIIFALFISLLSPIFFIFLILATIIFYPVDLVSKRIIIFRAKIKIKKHRNQIKIIGITGSYGKTTTKEAVFSVLSQKFNVLKTEGNKNTMLGVSKLVLNKLNPNIDIFLIEMAAYGEGDIKKLCNFVGGTDVSILTGINESHFERFKNIENTIRTKFEIVENCKKEGTVILNADDENVMNNFGRFIDKRKVLFFSSKNNEKSEFKFSEKSFDLKRAGISFNIKEDDHLIHTFNLPFLSDYVTGLALVSAVVGKELGMSWGEINKGIEKFRPVEHRLNAIQTRDNILIIDDSYNGNPEGVNKAIEALSLFSNRRKVYITPGLAEVGDKTEEIHREIGKKLSKVADFIVLEKNEAGKFIKEGLIQNGFLEKYIKTYNSIHDAHIDLDNIVMSSDVVLFQRGRSEFLFNWIESKKASKQEIV